MQPSHCSCWFCRTCTRSLAPLYNVYSYLGRRLCCVKYLKIHQDRCGNSGMTGGNYYLNEALIDQIHMENKISA